MILDLHHIHAERKCCLPFLREYGFAALFLFVRIKHRPFILFIVADLKRIAGYQRLRRAGKGLQTSRMPFQKVGIVFCRSVAAQDENDGNLADA